MSQRIRIAKCLGEENVQKAIENILGEEDGWVFHSCVPSGIEMIDDGEDMLLRRTPPRAISKFLVFFERHAHNA